MKLWPRHTIEHENAALREQVRLYEKMVATYKAELAEINAVLEKGK